MTPDKLKELRDRLANECATKKVISTRLHQLHVENFELGWDACEKELQSQLAKANEKLEKAREALRKIQNAYGSPYDEDFVTTEAREALREIDGTKEISDEGAG